jgi:hypothetical protein
MYDNELILSMGLLNFVSDFSARYVSMPLPKTIIPHARLPNCPSCGGLTGAHFPAPDKSLIFRDFIYLAKQRK